MEVGRGVGTDGGGGAAAQMLKTVSPKDTVLAAMQLMMDFNFRHVPVVRVPAQSRHPSLHTIQQSPESPSVCDATAALGREAAAAKLGRMVTCNEQKLYSNFRRRKGGAQVDKGHYLGMISIRDAVRRDSPCCFAPRPLSLYHSSLPGHEWEWAGKIWTRITDAFGNCISIVILVVIISS